MGESSNELVELEEDVLLIVVARLSGEDVVDLSNG